MWKLTIEDEEGKKTLLPLVRDEYQVGRDEGNTIRLTERNISRKHATLKKSGPAGWVLLDRDSYNGCYVNGERVAGEAKLASSDLIQVGDYRIFIATDATAEQGAEGPSADDAVPALRATPEKPDRIVQLAGPEPGKEFPLAVDMSTIGRAEDCTVSINHPSVSRVHAEVHALGAGRYEILDRGSSNGVRVNGVDLRRALLEGGDLIELGDVKLRFLEKGQSTRLGADISQQIASVTSQPAHSARPGAAPANGMRWVFVSAGAVAVLGVIALVTLRGGTEATSAPAVAQPAPDPGARALEAAKRLAAAGDDEGAVTKLAELPDGSPSRADAQFAAIYGRWADAVLKRADAATDADAKRALYTKVAQTTGLDAGRRKLAATALARLDTGGTAIDALPAAAAVDKPTAAPSGAAPPDPTTGGVATVIELDKPYPKRDPGSVALKDKPEKTDKAPPPEKDKPVAPSGDVLQADAETKARKQLEGRVWSGKATNDEIKMLRAICKHQNDRACAERAGQMLNK